MIVVMVELKFSKYIQSCLIAMKRLFVYILMLFCTGMVQTFAQTSIITVRGTVIDEIMFQLLVPMYFVVTIIKLLQMWTVDIVSVWSLMLY